MTTVSFLAVCEQPLGRTIAWTARPTRNHSAPDDVVLYRTAGGDIAPARLVEAAGGGCWLARDARHTRGLVYLEPESIVAHLPRPDLVGEAA